MFRESPNGDSAGRSKVSIASVAVGEFGKNIFSRFDNKTVLVIGAGEMASETLQYLKSEGVRKIVVANRSRPRADRLAEEFGGEAVDFSQLDHWLSKARCHCEYHWCRPNIDYSPAF